MTDVQFQREKNYRAALAIAKEMLLKGLIDKSDYTKIKKFLINKYNPVIGWL